MPQSTSVRLVTEARLNTLVFTNPKVYGATGDGATDDTAALTATVATGAKTVFVPDGTYICDHLLLNVANQTWLLSPGATIKAKTAATPTVIDITANGAGVVGVGYGATVDGNSVGTTASTTIYSHTGTDQIVQGLNVINAAGIAINTQSDRVLVDNNTITNPGNAGIFLSNVSGSNLVSPVVSGNRISVATGGAYGIQSHVNATGVIYRPRFFNNDVTLPAGVATGIGIELYGGNSFGSVVGNTVEGCQIGISVDLGPSITVTGNSIHGAYNYAVEFASASSSTCVGNTIDGNGITLQGISVSNTAGGRNTISGNSISNLSATGKGIFVQNVAGNGSTITGNNIIAYRPVALGGQSGHVVVGNVFTAANTGTLTGVDMDTTANSIVANNTFYGFTTAAVNCFTGTMAGIVVGPNILLGGTTVELLNGWTPGTNGVGSKLIRSNTTHGNPTTPAMPASTVAYVNTSFYQQTAYLRGGTVTLITRGGVTLATTTPATVSLESGDSMVVTYSVAPTLVVDTK